MVGAGQPQRRVAQHAMVAGQRILHHAVHGMAHVQLAGDVGRGHDDRKRLFIRISVRGKAAVFLPLLIEPALDLLRAEHLVHFDFLFRLHRDCSFLFHFVFPCLRETTVARADRLPKRICIPLSGIKKVPASKGRRDSVVPPYFAAHAASKLYRADPCKVTFLHPTALGSDLLRLHPQAVLQPMNRSLFGASARTPLLRRDI